MMQHIQLTVSALLILFLLLLGLYSAAATVLMLAFVVHHLAGIRHELRLQSHAAVRGTGSGTAATPLASQQR